MQRSPRAVWLRALAQQAQIGLPRRAIALRPGQGVQPGLRQDAPQQPQHPGGQGAADDGAGLTLGGKDAQEQQHDRYQRCTEKNPPPF